MSDFLYFRLTCSAGQSRHGSTGGFPQPAYHLLAAAGQWDSLPSNRGQTSRPKCIPTLNFEHQKLDTLPSMISKFTIHNNKVPKGKIFAPYSINFSQFDCFPSLIKSRSCLTFARSFFAIAAGRKQLWQSTWRLSWGFWTGSAFLRMLYWLSWHASHSAGFFSSKRLVGYTTKVEQNT